MNPDRNFLASSDSQRLTRNAYLVSIIAIVIVLIGAGLTVVWGEFGLLFITVLFLLIGIISAVLARRGKYMLGSALLVGAFALAAMARSLTSAGGGFSMALIVLGVCGSITITVWPRRLVTQSLIINLIIAGAVILTDLFGSANRTQQEMSPSLWVISFLALAVYLFFIIREFNDLDIRTKIITGILLTGGIAVGTLSFFAINRTGDIINSLSKRLETNVRLLAEEQLANTVFQEANHANQFFTDIAEEVNNLAEFRVSLQAKRETFRQGTYWDAATNLTKLDGGQYGNSKRDPSSVFVPVTTEVDETVLAELNTSAYLDLSTPQLLENNSNILAIYYVDPKGIVRYYPNIELASLLPPDFDATSRPYYEITSPLFNSQRLIRWTIPYIDAAGGGLVVTVASPVYFGNNFNGIVAADIQLTQITKQISAIRVGQSGYAFMIDDAGRIISMPVAGYEMLGINPDDLPKDEFYKQTILGQGPQDIRAIVTRMVAGGTGLNIVSVNGVDTYLAYTQLKSNGYSIAMVVPVAEMQTAIAIASSETQLLIQSAVRTASIILLILFLGAVLVSLVLGQIIATPVRRLTEVASQITGGDLTVQAQSTTRDEIGTLAQAFNAMTDRLRETLAGLERTIEERTSELIVANEANQRRARQFQAIAQVARSITSMLDFDRLLTQITTTISQEFGFYHVGVFLLDTAREYAVLSAANSEGGQVMLMRGHRLKVGEKGLVGFVSSTGRPRVALDTGADAVFFNNPDLPDTRSEVALPLRARETIIGVLDVQSREPNAFSQEDVSILSTLADQVSIAIQNARQNEATQKALSESDALSGQFVQAGWGRFIKKENLLGIRHTGAKSTILYSKKVTGKDDTLQSAGQLKSKGRGAIMSLPIKLRGQVIGSVDVRAPDNRKWDRDEIDIVTAIIERAAIAMENARLLNESQRRAVKERTIGEISARISAQSDVDELLKTAVQELNRTLPGTEIAIQFNKDQEAGNA